MSRSDHDPFAPRSETYPMYHGDPEAAARADAEDAEIDAEEAAEEAAEAPAEPAPPVDPEPAPEPPTKKTGARKGRSKRARREGPDLDAALKALDSQK